MATARSSKRLNAAEKPASPQSMAYCASRRRRQADLPAVRMAALAAEAVGHRHARALGTEQRPHHGSTSAGSDEVQHADARDEHPFPAGLARHPCARRSRWKQPPRPRSTCQTASPAQARPALARPRAPRSSRSVHRTAAPGSRRDAPAATRCGSVSAAPRTPYCMARPVKSCCPSLSMLTIRVVMVKLSGEI